MRDTHTPVARLGGYKIMVILKNILRWLTWAGLVAVVAIVVLYLLASWKPPHYQPARQTQEQKEVVTQVFYQEVLMFASEGRRGDAYEWPLDEDLVNEFLDAIDEIAFMRPNSRDKIHSRGDVHQMMDQAGLAEPCVRFADDCMTLMIRTNEYGKILSADIAFSFTDDGRLKFHLKSTRVGMLPVPRFAVRHRLQLFKQTLETRLEEIAEARVQAGLDDSEVAFEGFSSIDVTELFATIIAAIDEEPLPARIKFIDARVEDIQITDGKLLLKIVPEEEDEDD
jgi:hypothetical protein